MMGSKDSKYPYIPNKRLYAAVMYACKLIRETGYRNKAIRRAAGWYGVDEEDVDRELRKRQSAGQKGKSGTSRKYKWFVVDEYTHFQYRDEYEPYEPDADRFEVVRAVDASHAERKGGKRNFDRNNESWYGTERRVISEHETRSDAENALNEYRRAGCGEICRRFGDEPGLIGTESPEVER